MNSERLHAIARALQEDLRATESPALVAQLAQALRGGDQVQAAAHRQQLEERLAQAPSNDFSPAWREMVEELGVADLLGEALLERVRAILQRQEITPVAAGEELDEIGGRLLQLQTFLEQVINDLTFFGIGAEELEPGEFEVGFLIPRAAVDNQFERLGNELVKLDRMLGPFQELVTGTREELAVRTISSSGFQIYLAATPALALVMSKVLVNLLTSYQKILDIRDAHRRLQEDDVPAEAIQPILDHANERMSIDIEALTEALIVEFGAQAQDVGRVNELRLDIRHSLNALANRIDEGYSIEIRAGEVREGAEEEPGEGPDAEAVRAAELIKERQREIRFLDLTGTRILELPEGDGGQADEEPAAEEAGQ